MYLFLATTMAFAQSGGDSPTGLNVQAFRPSIDAVQTLWTDDAAMGPDKSFLARGLFHYTNDPLVYKVGGTETALVSDVLQLDAMGAFRFWRARVGFVLPVYLFADGAAENAKAGPGIGNMALDGKLTILEAENVPVRIAAQGRVNLPTGLTDYPLASGLGYELAAVVDFRGGPVLVALNAGHQGGPKTTLENVTLKDSFVWRAAGAVALGERGGVSLEAAGKLPYAVALTNPAGGSAEWLLGGYATFSDALKVRAGFGSGLTRGIGAPDVRAMVGLGYEPSPVKDPDKDGIVGKADACPKVAEDFDQFEDTDGCPELDNDNDGIADEADACKTEPEDMDGWQDTDGCPELDNDGDGLVDTADQCRDQAEDKDQVQDQDGCPEPELKARFVLVDSADQSVLQVGRLKVKGEGVAVTGAGEVILEVKPGKFSLDGSSAGYEAAKLEVTLDDGHTEGKLALKARKDNKLVVTKERISLNETVNFETNKAVIRSNSFNLLNQVVAVLKDYPEIKKLRVEGHTDSRGPDDKNLELSKKRAAAVMKYLIDNGVEPGRLASQGFGETKPLDTAENDAAWAKNRRVDMFIESWVDPAPPAPAPAPVP